MRPFDPFCLHILYHQSDHFYFCENFPGDEKERKKESHLHVKFYIRNVNVYLFSSSIWQNTAAG